MPSAQLLCVGPYDVHAVWPHVAPLIARAIRRTNLSHPNVIAADVRSGRALLWLAWNGHAIEAAATTSLVSTGAETICVLTACGGTHARRWTALIEGIEDYARAERCARLRIFGRKGWLRLLPGYTTKHIIMEKAL